jgi:hypothetical protein
MALKAGPEEAAATPGGGHDLRQQQERVCSRADWRGSPVMFTASTPTPADGPRRGTR